MANPGPPMAARCHSLPVPGMNHGTDDLPKRCAKRLDRSSAWLPPALLYVPAGHLSSRVEFLLKKMQFRQTLVPVLNSQRPLSFPLCPPGRVILVLAKTKMLSASLSWLGLSPVLETLSPTAAIRIKCIFLPFVSVPCYVPLTLASLTQR